MFPTARVEAKLTGLNTLSLGMGQAMGYFIGSCTNSIEHSKYMTGTEGGDKLKLTKLALPPCPFTFLFLNEWNNTTKYQIVNLYHVIYLYTMIQLIWSPNVKYCKYCTHLFHSFAWYVCTRFIIQFCSPSLTFCCLNNSHNSKLLPELHSSFSSKFMFSVLTTIPLATYDYLSRSEYIDSDPNNFLEQQVNRFWQILVWIKSETKERDWKEH